MFFHCGKIASLARAASGAKNQAAGEFGARNIVETGSSLNIPGLVVCLTVADRSGAYPESLSFSPRGRLVFASLNGAAWHEPRKAGSLSLHAST